MSTPTKQEATTVVAAMTFQVAAMAFANAAFHGLVTAAARDAAELSLVE